LRGRSRTGCRHEPRGVRGARDPAGEPGEHGGRCHPGRRRSTNLLLLLEKVLPRCSTILSPASAMTPSAIICPPLPVREPTTLNTILTAPPSSCLRPGSECCSASGLSIQTVPPSSKCQTARPPSTTHEVPLSREGARCVAAASICIASVGQPHCGHAWARVDTLS